MHPTFQDEIRGDATSWNPPSSTPKAIELPADSEPTPHSSKRKDDDKKISAGAPSALASAAPVAATVAERRPRAVRNLTYLAGEVRKAGLRWVAVSH